jgi:IS5 family transposase
MLLMALYSVRSERQFCEQLRYNLLFRWFLDMDMTGEAFDHSTFTNNRDRFIEGDVATKLFAAVVEQAKKRRLMSREHFSVDGTLIEAWASVKSFRPKDKKKRDKDDDGNGWGDFKGTKRSNDTHESTTDPDAKLLRKGKGREAKLCFAAHAMMENRNGLLVDFDVSQANGTCERDVAGEMLRRLPGKHRKTLGADAGYHTRAFVEECRAREVSAHVAQYRPGPGSRRSAIDGRTTRHDGYRTSLRVRKRIEQVFGWLKTTACSRKSRFIGLPRTGFFTTVAAAAYNLVRMSRLVASTAT